MGKLANRKKWDDSGRSWEIFGVGGFLDGFIGRKSLVQDGHESCDGLKSYGIV